MKIGIMTFWWSNDNYGQILQCYALQKYLCEMGHDAFLIRYDYRNDIMKTTIARRLLKALNPIRLINHIKYIRNEKEIKNEELNHDRNFSDFRRKYIIQSDFEYKSYTQLKNNPPVADAYIVGSDQVWNMWFKNFRLYKNPFHAYFLDFGNEKIKRLSYAASWGVTSLPDSFCKEVMFLLSKFNYVSVREKSGINLCEKCGYPNAEWVCDPTLLLSSEDYRSIYKENVIRKPEEPYILLYMLGNKCDFNLQSVFNFAKEKSLQVIYVTGNSKVDKRDKYFATIPEWLYLVDNAEYVITNSFHCAVFSTIFYKKFGVIKLSGNSKGMNSRFDSLFKLREIETRYISENNFTILDKPYKLKEINISKKFLEMLK